MPVTFGNNTGDGLQTTFIQTAVMMPDAGNTVNVEGMVHAPASLNGGVDPGLQRFSTTVNAPSVPGSGSTYWNIQVDYTTGAVTAQTSSVSDPAAIANNVVIFRQTLTFAVSTADLALDPSSTPDTY